MDIVLSEYICSILKFRRQGLAVAGERIEDCRGQMIEREGNLQFVAGNMFEDSQLTRTVSCSLT